jgi:hypothetical protein
MFPLTNSFAHEKQIQRKRFAKPFAPSVEADKSVRTVDENSGNSKSGLLHQSMEVLTVSAANDCSLS